MLKKISSSSKYLLISSFSSYLCFQKRAYCQITPPSSTSTSTNTTTTTSSLPNTTTSTIVGDNQSITLATMRKEYSKQYLEEENMPNNPTELFLLWLKEAKDAQVLEPNAMCLSTSNKHTNQPSGRMVLLKDFDERGFVWFTNYTSRKANDLYDNPLASLTFWWGDLERSVRVEGSVEKISEEESDKYHSVRPVDSQIGAWSSNQSSRIESREKLIEQENLVREKLSKEYLDNGTPIPRPKHWGGYRLSPQKIEFWKGRGGRMHDRILYERKEDKDGKIEWTKTRLQP